MTPETLVSVFCPSTTRSDKTRIRLCVCGAATAGLGLISSIFRSLPELVEALAERNDRIDVGLGVDAEVDQEGALGALRGVEGRSDVLEFLHAQRGQPVRLAELHEVRHVGQVDL